MKKALIIILVLVVLMVTGAILAGPALRDAVGKLSAEPSGTEVRVEAARSGRLVETVQAPGIIEPHTSVAIAAEVSARIIELPFKEGDEVRKGAIIGKLDDRDLQATLASTGARRDAQKFQLEADRRRLVGLRTNLDFANRELERIQTLYESGDKSERDLEAVLERVEDLTTSEQSMVHAIDVGESTLAAANADIERAQDGLDNTTILSPMDGMITLLNVEVGEIVTGSTTNPGTVLMIIADLSRMVHKAEVAESDIAGVDVGQRALLHINAYPDEVFSGTVRQIAWQRSNNMDGTGFFETEVEMDLQGRRIRSGHRANADIEIDAHDGIIVPRQAIVVREIDELPDEIRKDPLVDLSKTKCNVVYRVIDGKAVCTPIEAGASDLTHRLILAGLAADEIVIVGPYKVLESVKHDQAVKIKGDDEQDAGAGEGEDDSETGGDANEAKDDSVGDGGSVEDRPEDDAATKGDETP